MRWSTKFCAGVALMMMSGPSLHAEPTLTAQTSQPATGTIALGQPVLITFSLSGLPADKGNQLQLVVKDEYGKTLSQTTLAVTIDHAGQGQAVFKAPAARLGYYEVHASLADGTTLAPLGTRPAGLISYAVVPDPSLRKLYPAAQTRFGMQGGFSYAAQVLPLLGVRWTFEHDAWSNQEPKGPGTYLGPVPTVAEKAHRDEIKDVTWQGQHWVTYPYVPLIKSALPDWALLPGTGGTQCKASGALNDAGKEAFPKFVAARARAFVQERPDVDPHIYQVTWEPFKGWCYGGTPEQMVEIYARAHDAIHKTDPHGLVAGPTLFLDKADSAQLDALWAAGLGRYLDVLSMHPYTQGFPPETHGLPGELRHQLAAASQAAGHPMPFMGTEHGFTNDDGGILTKARGDVRSTLIMLGEGAILDFAFYAVDWIEPGLKGGPRTYGFYWNLDPKRSWGAQVIGPKPAAPAYAAMTFLLDGASSKGLLAGLSGSQLGYRFVRGGDQIDAVWDYGAGSSWQVPAGMDLCDWMGNCARQGKARSVPLNGTPIYLIKRDSTHAAG